MVKEQAFPTVPNEKLPAIANASKKEAEELAMLEKELAGKRKGFVVVRFSRWSVSYRRVAAGPNRSRASEGGWDGGGMKRRRYRQRRRSLSRYPSRGGAAATVAARVGAAYFYGSITA